MLSYLLFSVNLYNKAVSAFFSGPFVCLFVCLYIQGIFLGKE